MKITLSALAMSMGLLFSNSVLAFGTYDSHVHTGGPRGQAMYPHEHADYLGFGRPGQEADVSRTVKLSAGDEMNYAMPSLSIKQGDTVRFVFTNTGSGTHEFFVADEDTLRQIDAMRAGNPDQSLDRPYGVRVKAGESKTIVWRFDRSGSFQLACHMPGSIKTSMTGQIDVMSLPKRGPR